MVASALEPRPLVVRDVPRGGHTLRLQTPTPVDDEEIKASCSIAGARILLPSASALQRAESERLVGVLVARTRAPVIPAFRTKLLAGPTCRSLRKAVVSIGPLGTLPEIAQTQVRVGGGQS